MNDERTDAAVARSTPAWSIVWGVLMLLCGLLAICMPFASSIGLVIALGWLILICAVWHLVFAFHTRGFGNILWEVLLAIIYGVAGFYLLWHPLLGVLTLTLVLALFLLFEGIVEIVSYFAIRSVRNSGWVLLDGIITLLLGFFLWRHWPSTSAWVIGTLVGVSLIFSGISRIMLCASHRGLDPVTV
jgi:uncharacterized membrane protein HdeD (DUF308 family)